MSTIKNLWNKTETEVVVTSSPENSVEKIARPESFVDVLDKNQYINADSDHGREPTDEEMKTLRHVSEQIPVRCWLVAVVELAERFSYYGLSAPFQNYMQNGPNDTPKAVSYTHLDVYKRQLPLMVPLSDTSMQRMLLRINKCWQKLVTRKN